jgi:catechol 2,3-dioxygenase-like lactoylglutathione lyase family enzyme
METDRREGQIVECSCCGGQRDTVALASRDDVRLCRDCVEWLSGKLGIVSTPTLPVRDLNEAIDFYERAGFGVRAYKEDEDYPGDGFAFVDYAGQSVFDLDVVDVEPAENHAGCYLIVPDPDGWHFRLAADGLSVTALEDQPWGMREFTLTDPSGNNVRVGHSIS